MDGLTVPKHICDVARSVDAMLGHPSNDPPRLHICAAGAGKVGRGDQAVDSAAGISRDARWVLTQGRATKPAAGICKTLPGLRLNR